MAATGPVNRYGDEFDFNYSNDANWNSRLNSLTGEGGIYIAATHWFSSVLKEPLADAPVAGQKQFTYMKLEFLMLSPLLKHFSTALLDRRQMLTLKLRPLVWTEGVCLSGSGLRASPLCNGSTNVHMPRRLSLKGDNSPFTTYNIYNIRSGRAVTRGSLGATEAIRDGGKPGTDTDGVHHTRTT